LNIEDLRKHRQFCSLLCCLNLTLLLCLNTDYFMSVYRVSAVVYLLPLHHGRYYSGGVNMMHLYISEQVLYNNVGFVAEFSCWV